MKHKSVNNISRAGVLRRIVLGAIASVMLVMMASPLLHAQGNPEGSFNLIVSPLPVSLETKPGSTVSTELKFRNAGNVTENVKISVMKFGAEGEDGTPKLLDAEPGDEFMKWVTFSQTRVEAEPNVWKTVKMDINPPSTAAFGYYYAIIFSRDKAEEQIQPQKANLLGAVASLVLLDVQAPGAKREATLTEFSMPKKMYEFLPADFTVRLKNTGNVHVAPRGNIFITQGGDNQALLEVNLDKGYILPDSARKFTTFWQDGNPVYKIKEAGGKAVLDKNGKQQRFLDWSNFNPSKIRFGKYNARLVMVYNDGTRDVPVEGTVSFWVIPWRILGVLLLVLLFVGAGLYATIIRPLKNRLKKKS